MKVIIAGSRDITNMQYVYEAWDMVDWVPTEIVSGGARGVDKLGEQYAQDQNLALSVFEAEWEKYPKSAGPMRNVKMGNYANALLAIWDGKSKGTGHMIEYMTKLQKPVSVLIV